MLLSRPLAAAALGAATLVAAPPDALAHPNSIGKVCSYLAVSEGEPGQRQVHTGALYAGPWVVTVATSIVIDCVFTVNDVIVLRSVQESGGSVATFTPLPISYVAASNDPVKICTYVTWTDLAGAPHGWTGKVDADGDYFCDYVV